MILFNGKSADFIPAWDRGLHYGDGVFRTLKVINGQVCVWARQYAKLEQDCASLLLGCPPEKQLLSEIEQVTSELTDCAVKIVITRGVGNRGYALPKHAVSNRLVLASPLPVYPESHRIDGITMHRCETRYSQQPRLAGIKHLNRLENVLARSEWDTPDIAEGLMLDAQDRVISGTMSNLFMVHDGRLVTPELDLCGIAGVQRERIIEAAKKLEISLNVNRIDMIKLNMSEEVFVCNSLINLWPVTRIANREWPVGGITRRIESWLAHHD